MKRCCLLLLALSFSQISSPFTKTITDHIVKNYATQPLSKKQTKLVVSIMKEMGITKPIDMRLGNWRMKSTWGRNNALAMYDQYLIISDSFFDELSKKEQRFLIGHELSHIKFNHNRKQLALSLLLLILAFFTYRKIRKALKAHISRRIISLPLSVACLWLLLVGNRIVKASASRICERQADMESIRCLNCPKGGIKFMERLEQVHHITLPQNRFQKTMAPWIATHPSCKERIEYINNSQNKKGSK